MLHHRILFIKKIENRTDRQTIFTICSRCERVRSDASARAAAAAREKIGLVKLISFILVSLNIDIDGECMQPTRHVCLC